MQLMWRIALTVVLTSFLWWGAKAESGRKLRIALQLPDNNHVYDNLELFKQLVERGTDGAVQIEVAHSGRLLKEQDAPKAVATGTVEMASVGVHQYGSAIPAADLFVQPFMFAYPPALVAVTRPGSRVRVLIDEALLQRTGARALWWQPSGTMVMVSTDAPLTTPGAIKGKRVRVSSESEGEFVNLCGGIAIVVPAAAHYEAYKAEKLEAGSSTIVGVQARNLWEVAKFVTYTRHRTSVFVVTINERLWQSLPMHHKRVIEQAAGEAERGVWTRMETVEREANAVAEKNGMTVVDLTRGTELDQWQACAAPMLEAYSVRAGQLGSQVLAGYREALVEASRSTPIQVRKQ
jgi:TRAP-type C4-dicarboxylate transport system substrate-binding protein